MAAAMLGLNPSTLCYHQKAADPQCSKKAEPPRAE
jgi:hypothetical protein